MWCIKTQTEDEGTHLDIYSTFQEAWERHCHLVNEVYWKNSLVFDQFYELKT